MNFIHEYEKISGKSAVGLTVRENEENPYAGDSDIKISVLSDGEVEVWADENGKLIQVGPVIGSYDRKKAEGDNIGVPRLREIAIEKATMVVPSFRSLLSELHPLEANDMRTVYFFRWEDLSNPLKETELPPFLQIGLYPDGSLASFACTLER